MIINNKLDLKIYEVNLSNNKDSKLGPENKLEPEYKNVDFEKDTKEDKNADINHNVYNSIRIQVNMMDYQQRSIQEKISLIQAEELKINQIENSLRKAKEIYMQSIQNKSKEESEYKNIIKDFVKQVSNKEKRLEDKNYKLNKENEYNQNKQEHTDLNSDFTEYNNINDINSALREIANIKTKLAESKDKLSSLENMIENVKAKIKNEENYIEDYIEVIKYTKEFILINPSRYMNSQNNIINDMVLNIFR